MWALPCTTSMIGSSSPFRERTMSTAPPDGAIPDDMDEMDLPRQDSAIADARPGTSFTFLCPNSMLAGYITKRGAADPCTDMLMLFPSSKRISTISPLGLQAE